MVFAVFGGPRDDQWVRDWIDRRDWEKAGVHSPIPQSPKAREIAQIAGDTLADAFGLRSRSVVHRVRPNRAGQC